MEEIGMTDAQWKYNLRMQLENWEDVKELIDQIETIETNPIVKQALNLVNRNIENIEKELEG